MHAHMYVHAPFCMEVRGQLGDVGSPPQCAFWGIIRRSSGLVARSFVFSFINSLISLSLDLIWSFCFCSFFGCMCVSCMCSCVCQCHKYVCAIVENRSQCWLSFSIALSFWDRVSLHLELTSSATLAGRQASELLLALPGQYWDYMHSLARLAFYRSSRDSNSCLHAWAVSTLLTESSMSSPLFWFLCKSSLLISNLT